MILPPVILLRGGPAVGKSTTARLLADLLPQSAVVEQDVLRYMVHGGLVAARRGTHQSVYEIGVAPSVRRLRGFNYRPNYRGTPAGAALFVSDRYFLPSSAVYWLNWTRVVVCPSRCCHSRSTPEQRPLTRSLPA